MHSGVERRVFKWIECLVVSFPTEERKAKTPPKRRWLSAETNNINI